MADLAPVAANVSAGTGAVPERGTLGETCTAGQVVYKDANMSNQLKLADATTAAKAAAVGVLINGGSDGQPASYIKTGILDPGISAVKGKVYAVSATAGKIALASDLLTPKFMTVIGIGKADGTIKMGLNVSGEAI